MARKFRAVLLLFSFFSSTSFAQILPDILWDPDNPIFDKNVCNMASKTVYAKLDDKLTFLCGNPHINIKFKERNSVQRKVNEYYYNIYLTNDYDVFWNRNADDSKSTLINQCHAEETEENFVRYPVFSTSVTLSKYSARAIPGFKENQKYWFFTTSNGTKESLNTKVGDPNSDMSIELHICKNVEPCSGRKRLNVCKEPKLKNDVSSIRGTNDGSGSSDAFNVSHFGRAEVLLTICFAVLIGIVLGFFLAHGRSKCKKEQRQDDRHLGVKRLCSTNSQAPMLSKLESENVNDATDENHVSDFDVNHIISEFV